MFSSQLITLQAGILLWETPLGSSLQHRRSTFLSFVSTKLRAPKRLLDFGDYNRHDWGSRVLRQINQQDKHQLQTLFYDSSGTSSKEKRGAFFEPYRTLV